MRLALFLAVLGFFATPSWAGRTSEDAALAAARADHRNNGQMEPKALATAIGRARREGDVLTLTLSSRSPLPLASNSAACVNDESACVRYTLVADLPTRHSYLVAKGYYEGCGDLLLIDDRSGRETVFAEVPVFSPDGRRLLIQNDCEADGSASDNHLEIWRRQTDGWVLEWRYTDAEAYAADPTLKNVFRSNVVAWRGDRIEMIFIDPAFAQAPERRWAGTLQRHNGHWVLKAGALHSP